MLLVLWRVSIRRVGHFKTNLESNVSNFIEAIIKENPEVPVITRFPPEPNGHLHLGHVKSIVLNFELAEKHGGKCYLRFDDTNPESESEEFVEAIKRDIEWLGYTPFKITYASDYFETMRSLANSMILEGRAYLCTCDASTVSRMRGTVKIDGTRCPCNRLGDHSKLFNLMIEGKLEGTLRAKIDMSSNNMKMRDPIMYRIKSTPHHKTGDTVCPMYDFAHPISDAEEGITYSICTLEFDNNRELYDWYNKRWEYFTSNTASNKQYEMARLNLEGIKLSKRHLAEFVEENDIGWDDPSMPTISGLSSRGIPPDALKEFVRDIGVSRSDNTLVSTAKFNSVIRDHLNDKAPRIMGVLKPLKLIISGLPEDSEGIVIHGEHWPKGMGKSKTRSIHLTSEVWIDRDDFSIEPPRKWKRFSPHYVVRLRYGCIVRCTGYKEEDGEVTEVYADYINGTIGGGFDIPSEKVKVNGTVHWVSSEHYKLAMFKTYSGMESELFEGYIEDLDYINGQRYQLERVGYFYVVKSKPIGIGMRRIVPLRDGYGVKR